MENFAKLVAEKSGGTIEIDIYSNGELSGRNSQTTFKLLQSGDIDMAIVPQMCIRDRPPLLSC